MDSHVLIAILHILLIVPFLLWVGIARGSFPDWVFTLLMALGAILVLYQGYKAYTRFLKSSSYIWVNLIHVLWIGPLLFYIGYKKKDTPRPAYELLLLTAFGALGYHLYSIATEYDFL
jgi:hypothetical protein